MDAPIARDENGNMTDEYKLWLLSQGGAELMKPKDKKVCAKRRCCMCDKVAKRSEFCKTPEGDDRWCCLECDEQMVNCAKCGNCPNMFYKDAVEIDAGWYCKECANTIPKFKVLEASLYKPTILYKIPGGWDIKDIYVIDEGLYYRGELMECPSVETEGDLGKAEIQIVEMDDDEIDDYFDCE